MSEAKALVTQGQKDGCKRKCTSEFINLVATADKAILVLAAECNNIYTP